MRTFHGTGTTTGTTTTTTTTTTTKLIHYRFKFDINCFLALSKGVPIAAILDEEEQERISVIEKISL